MCQFDLLLVSIGVGLLPLLPHSSLLSSELLDAQHSFIILWGAKLLAGCATAQCRFRCIHHHLCSLRPSHGRLLCRCPLLDILNSNVVQVFCRLSTWRVASLWHRYRG
eukprot:5497342-Pyramimonas_sp.AAC.1